MKKPEVTQQDIPEVPRYAYAYSGIGEVSAVTSGKIDGGPSFEVVVKTPWHFRGIVESETPLTDNDVRDRVDPPKEGYLVADARSLTIKQIDGPLPEAPTKPRPNKEG